MAAANDIMQPLFRLVHMQMATRSVKGVCVAFGSTVGMWRKKREQGEKLQTKAGK